MAGSSSASRIGFRETLSMQGGAGAIGAPVLATASQSKLSYRLAPSSSKLIPGAAMSALRSPWLISPPIGCGGGLRVKGLRSTGKGLWVGEVRVRGYGLEKYG